MQEKENVFEGEKKGGKKSSWRQVIVNFIYSVISVWDGGLVGCVSQVNGKQDEEEEVSNVQHEKSL